MKYFFYGIGVLDLIFLIQMVMIKSLSSIMITFLQILVLWWILQLIVDMICRPSNTDYLSWKPLFVIVNPKSGGSEGFAALRTFRKLLHPVQVKELLNFQGSRKVINWISSLTLLANFNILNHSKNELSSLQIYYCMSQVLFWKIQDTRFHDCRS